jgi:hypothetical protein
MDPRAGTALIALVAGAAIGLVRAPLAGMHQRIKETSEVYTLPPPQQLVRLSLGYRSALADVLWSYVMVSQGIHTQERRRFDNLTHLYDAINELEPTYREPYLFADALITFQVTKTPHEEVLLTRSILERGMRNRPLDGGLWLAAGEFIAYIAPASYLTDPAEQAEWRMAGARILARTAEIGGSDPTIAWRAVGGASILRRAGEREAAVRFLQRTLAITDDPELKDKIRAQLFALHRDQLFPRLEQGVYDLRHGDLPFVSRMEYLVLGPPRDPALCAGPAHERDPDCAPTWHEWEQLSDEAGEADR